MTAQELYAALKQKGYRNSDCDSTLAARQRVLTGKLRQRWYQRQPDPVAVHAVLDRHLRDALELDRTQAFRVWFGEKQVPDPYNTGSTTASWKARLLHAVTYQLNGEIGHCIEYLFSHS